MAGRRSHFIWAAGVCTFFGLSATAQHVVMLRRAGAPFLWERIAAFHLADWWLVAVLTPVLFWMVDRWPITRKTWGRNAPLQFALALALVPVKFLLTLPILRLLWPQGEFSLGQQLAQGFFPQLATFWAILGVLHAIESARRESRLAAWLSEARLHALQLQLEPHFLFNTLHAISSLMHTDVEAADTMLVELADLLRSMLGDQRRLIPLRDELALLERYLAIMRVRFGDRLDVRMDVSRETLDTPVPSLLLQPVVENAIRHGIEKIGAGKVEIAALHDHGRLRLTVRDNGPGLDGRQGNGVGLSNLRARLRELYQDRSTLELSGAPGGGLQVSIQLPAEARS